MTPALRDPSRCAAAASDVSRDDRAATPRSRDHPIVETLRYRAILAGLPLLRALRHAR